MPSRSRTALAALGLVLLAYARVCCDPLPLPRADPEARGSSGMSPAVSSPDTVRVAARMDLSAAYREHAPLAWFSLGSLAVGGVFYGISRGLDRPNVSYAAGSRSQMGTAVALAGASALLAAGSYFYYAHHAPKAQDGDEPVSDWEASLQGAPDGAGGLAVAARVSLPLPSLR
jgi:hypothetical protein